MSQHLTLQQRKTIQHALEQHQSFRSLAHELGKASSTISREVRKHSLVSDKGAPHRIRNRCVHRTHCDVYGVCAQQPNCTRKCSTCPHCNSHCQKFLEEVCPALSLPPYVCNGCSQLSVCTLRKKFYDARLGDACYHELLVASRQGANITEEELIQLDGILYPLIRHGHSLHHVMTHHADELPCAERTLYRYIDACLLTARNIDMPRVCRIKPRKSKPLQAKVDKACRIGRTFDDFITFREQHPQTPCVQMDSVIGRVGGKVLLTLILPGQDLLLAFLRDANTSKSVIDTFHMLCQLMGLELFKTIFPVLLTDNGSEFTNPKAIETNADGVQRTRVFYCNPYAPYEKPNVEHIHEFIRRVLPKGSSFDGLSQQDIDLLMSHINSYGRQKFNGLSPLQLFISSFGAQLAALLHLSVIPPDDIILRPSLLKR